MLSLIFVCSRFFFRDQALEKKQEKKLSSISRLVMRHYAVFFRNHDK